MLFDLDAYTREPGVRKKDGGEERPARILIAEDDHELRRLLVRALSAAGYGVTQCVTGTELLEQLSSYVFLEPERGYDLVVTDIRMPGVTGMEILDGLHACENLPPVILITAFGDDETHRKAMKLGAAAILDKPFEVDLLVSCIAEVLENRRLREAATKSHPGV